MASYLLAPATSVQSAMTRTLGWPPTKGLLLWTFVDEACDDVEIELHKVRGNEVISRGPKHNYTDAADMEFGFIDDTAKLSIKVKGKTVKKFTMTVGAISGSLSTDIPPARSNPAIEIGDYLVSLGIFDSTFGFKHELYVHVARKQPEWMGALPAELPFHVLCLPGAHDAGSNTTAALDKIKADDKMKEALMKLIGPVLAGLVIERFEDYAIWLGGLTQKDSFTAMLETGVRFFDFRAGYCVREIYELGMKDIYHQHSLLPGARWLDALTEILQFLTNHPTEIVQVSLNCNGFVQDTMKPSEGDMKNIVRKALSAEGVDKTIKIVGPEAFQLTLAELRKANSRLIITDATYGPKINALDAWNEADWSTIDPSTIQGAFEKSITNEAQAGRDMTVFQIQATATDYYLKGPHKALLLTLLNANNYNLPLVSTKGRFSTKLLDFIRTYEKTLEGKQHMVILDDWVDGFTVSTAIEITNKRI